MKKLLMSCILIFGCVSQLAALPEKLNINVEAVEKHFQYQIEDAQMIVVGMQTNINLLEDEYKNLQAMEEGVPDFTNAVLDAQKGFYMENLPNPLYNRTLPFDWVPVTINSTLEKTHVLFQEICKAKLELFYAENRVKKIKELKKLIKRYNNHYNGFLGVIEEMNNDVLEESINDNSFAVRMYERFFLKANEYLIRFDLLEK